MSKSTVAAFTKTRHRRSELVVGGIALGLIVAVILTVTVLLLILLARVAL